MKMKLTVTGFIYYLKLSLLVRGIFASSIDNDECTENEDNMDTSSIIVRSSNKRSTETATSIVYVYASQTSFNSQMALGHPATILIASTRIEVLTITPGKEDATETFMQSYKETTDVPTVGNESIPQTISTCSGCSMLSNNGASTSKKNLELITESKSPYSLVTSPRISTTVSPASITSIKSHSTSFSKHSVSTNTSKQKPVSSARYLSRTGLSYSCDASICVSTDSPSSTSRDEHILSSVSKKSTKSLKNKTEGSSNEVAHKTSYIESSSISTSVGTTSYHYYDSTGIKQSLHTPIILSLLLLDIISF